MKKEFDIEISLFYMHNENTFKIRKRRENISDFILGGNKHEFRNFEHERKKNALTYTTHNLKFYGVIL